MQDKSALGRAIAMVRDLRSRCPWDRAQNRESLRPYLIEEVHELDHALTSGDPAAIREEVSDLLLHLAWQLVLAGELGEFTADDVASDLERKMRRRHPHLFDLGPAEPWQRLKQKEKSRGTLEGLPPSLPALLMAWRLQERAATVGFDWPDATGPGAKVREELEEVEQEIERAAPLVPTAPSATPEPPAPVRPPPKVGNASGGLQRHRPVRAIGYRHGCHAVPCSITAYRRRSGTPQVLSLAWHGGENTSLRGSIPSSHWRSQALRVNGRFLRPQGRRHHALLHVATTRRVGGRRRRPALPSGGER